MNNKIYNDGLVPDLRADELKAKDYRQLVSAGLRDAIWLEKLEILWKQYIPREQDSSLSCVAHSGAKAMTILNPKEYSAHPSYRARSNFPQGGMFLQNLGEILKNKGTTLESLDVSENQGEIQMNRDIRVLTPDKIGGYYFVPFKDIDAIADVIQRFQHCILIIHGNKKEWTAIPVYNGQEENFGHAICLVDYFLYKGQKVLLAEDSTSHINSFDGQGRRLITEHYLLKRAAGAMYFTAEIPIPPFKFTQTMRMGNRGGQVFELQKFLAKSENVVLVLDGIFGAKTLGAVKMFQKNHGLVEDGIFGLKSRTVANLLI